MSQVLPFRLSTSLVLAMVSILVLDLLAIGLVLVAEGVGRWVMALVALAMVIGTGFVFRGLRRRAVELDGSRIGWRNGITATRWWTERDSVVAVTRHRTGPVWRPGQNVVLWSSGGGMGPVTGLMSRIGLQRDDRARVEELAGSDPLRPFVIPMSDLRPEGAALVEAWLDVRFGDGSR